MFLYRKNIILVPSDYDGVSITKGLLSFDCYDNFANCTLRCYNLNTQNKLTLGIAIEKKMHKFEIKPNNAKNYSFQINQKISSGQNISCVLLDIGQDNYHIELWGSTQINTAWQSTLKMMIENENNFENIDENIKKMQKNQEILQKNSKNDAIFAKNDKNIESQANQNFETKTCKNKTENNFEMSKNNFEIENKSSFIQTEKDDVELENFIDHVIKITEDDVAQNSGDYINQNCFDDEKYFNQTNIQSKNNQDKTKIFDNENLNNDKLTNEESNSFVERIQTQIDKMFENNMEEKVLNEIFPNSKFCRVDFDDKTGYYVFGVIYDDSTPKYLCYGIPSQKNQNPPKEMSNYYQWLPLDTSDEDGDGFYMMYQDAQTGKNISVDII